MDRVVHNGNGKVVSARTGDQVDQASQPEGGVWSQKGQREEKEMDLLNMSCCVPL